MANVKRCPFCSSADVAIFPVSEGVEGRYMVACKQCDAEGPVGDTETNAAARWNTRGIMSAKRAKEYIKAFIRGNRE